MDDADQVRPVAGWYMAGAVASLLFMGLGCIMYLMNVMADPAQMPIEQRTAHEAQPTWVLAANAVAVWIGLAGTIFLVMKRRLAEPAMFVSLAAVLIWLAGLILVTPLRENLSANDLLVAIIVSAITWTIFWFARHSRQKGWLR